jgi:hypothetical protein
VQYVHKPIQDMVTHMLFVLSSLSMAGVEVLQSLTSRAGKCSNDEPLMLEAILPQKEDILRLLRTSLTDSEAKVTALSSTVFSDMTWWP